MIDIDYAKISIEELDKIRFMHNITFDFICDGDSKKIILERNEGE